MSIPEEVVFSVSVIKKGKGAGVVFKSENSQLEEVPKSPGVYRVFSKTDKRTFYCGETGNLFKRLTFLFRCNSGTNPHPCHTAYESAYGRPIEAAKFCEEFSVAIINTEGLIGRLEIEDKLKFQYKSNNKNFYEKWLNKPS
jgi:hypothetical protein